MVGCSSKKGMKHKQDKDLDEKEYNFYQNLTSRYNILHNARLMLDEEQTKISSGKKANYQIRQDVFDDPEEQQIFHEMMDSVIRKTYKIINDKTESKYIDEAYLLIGRANYLKGAFYNATEYFTYLIRYTENKDKYLPIAYAWKSRALHQTGKHEQASLASDSALLFMAESKKPLAFVHATKANSLIVIGKEENAIPHLERAVERTKNSKDRYRWTLLLAQLYAEKQDRTNALKRYTRISRANVPFDMAFEAGIQAATWQAALHENVESKVKPLQKMLREGKNDGFQDQIYHQIGLVYLQAEKDSIAVDFFNRSLQQESGNAYQATDTYMVLADHYFKNKKYSRAQSYYDLVASTIPADYTNVDRIRRKLTQMSELTKLYEEITWQDTLLHLAALSPAERDTTITIYAQKNVAEILKQKQQENAKAQSTKRAQATTSTNNRLAQHNTLAMMQQTTYSGDKFYFNNPDAMSLGESEFRRRWGNRELVDDWRFNAQARQNTIPTATAQTEEENQAEKNEEIDEATLLQAEKNRYTETLPKTQEDIDGANSTVHDNLLSIANIYRDYARDDQEAALAFEQFLLRFPNTEEGPYAYYSLYRLYDGLDDAKSAEYKNRLISLFPESIHARVAQDPHYLDKMNKEKLVLDREFEKIFTHYTGRNYAEVVEESDQILTKGFTNEKLLAQIDYLKTLAIGHIGNVKDFTVALEYITSQYPQDSLVTPLATEHLAYLKNHPDQFLDTLSALQNLDAERIAFIDEPTMTPWPELVINRNYRTSVAIAKKEPEKKEERVATGKLNRVEGTNTSLIQKEISIGTISARPDLVSKVNVELGPNDFRDQNLLPDTATYYFVINVMQPTANLAPSRYGIGQFNRSRYARASITHQLSRINNENQLVYIGTFGTYASAKEYESRIRPMLGEIMKIPQENYNIFVITKELLETLTDGTKIDQYHEMYSEQP